MFHLLGFIFIIFIVILVVGLSIVGSVLRALFGFGRRRPAPSDNAHRSYRSVNPEDNGGDTKENEKVINDPSASKHKKIFAKDDGEYVDFEEVK
ncbi:MAG: DUF4834 family protein [Bacteroides sp.]